MLGNPLAMLVTPAYNARAKKRMQKFYDIFDRRHGTPLEIVLGSSDECPIPSAKMQKRFNFNGQDECLVPLKFVYFLARYAYYVAI
jgi:hypothetical protein